MFNIENFMAGIYKRNMKKKYILSLCIAFSLLVLPFATFATYNDFVTDAAITVPLDVENSGIYTNLTISSGATVEVMTIGTDRINLTIAAGSSIVITSGSSKEFEVAGFTGEYTTACTDSASTVTITATGGSTSHSGYVKPLSATCSTSTGSGGGGGGGGAPSTITPTNPSISINAGGAQTRNREVTLTLGATNATMMTISENSNFTDAVWENFASSKTFTLSESLGNKTVYVKYKSSTGNESSVVNDSIVLTEALPATTTQTIRAGVGGTITLSDGSASVLIPGGAFSQDAEVTIGPTENYVSPNVGEAVVGSQAFDFVAKVDGVNLSTFNSDVTLTFQYTDEQIKGLKEDTLKVYYWSDTLNDWVLAGGVINLSENKISVDIDHFTLFVIIGDKEFGTGELVKLACDGSNSAVCSAVYYLGNDGKRYVFPNEKIYFSWYDDFSNIKEISADDLASYAIGGNVTYRPGIRMVKITSDPKVYVVGKNGMLRWIQSESVASALYGSTWNQYIDDLVDSFFFSYIVGTDVAVAADFDKDAIKAGSTDINMDKGL